MALQRKPSATQANVSSGVLADFPQFAPLLVEEPGGQETNAAIQQWWNTTKFQLLQQQQTNENQFKITATAIGPTGTLQAQIDEERTVRADADSALATDITTVSATLTTDIGMVSASVTALATATATSLGFLSGKYTLTVTAGNVVTGMNITSSSGSGTDISSVIFRATDFQIYNGVTGVTMFQVSGSNVNLANTLTVSTSGKIFSGVGTYANNNTPFYVDSISDFSLGAGLTWDGVGHVLTINGTGTFSGAITATSGTIGGWTINSTTLSKNNAVLDSAGNLLLGTSNDVVILSATDAVYRMWVGNATAGSAAFSVTKTGDIFSNTGMIGGFTISASDLHQGSGANGIYLVNSAPPYIRVGEQSGSGSSSLLQNTAITMIVSANAQGSLYQSGSEVFLDVRSSSGVTKFSVNGGTGVITGNGSILTALNASNITSGALSIAGAITSTGAAVTSGVKCSAPLGEFDNATLSASGTLTIGGDTNVYRSSANVLKTDDNLIVNLEILCGSGVSSSATALEVQSGFFKYGTFTGTPVTHTGTIPMKDIFGTTRLIMIGA